MNNINKKMALITFCLAIFIFLTHSTEQKRIVSLTPSITKILFHLQVESSIVGVTDFCEFEGKVAKLVKSGKIKRVSGYNVINYEKIVLTNPDIILGMDSISMETKIKMDKLFANKKIFWFKHPKNFVEIKKQIVDIGQIVNKTEKATQIVNDMDRELDLINKKISTIDEEQKPKVLVEIFYPPFTTAGVNTYISDIILKAGGRLAIKVNEEWTNVSMEDIVKSAPDVIVKTHLENNNANLMLIKAYKEGRVLTLSNIDYILQPGVESVNAVKEIYNYLYGATIK